MTTKVTRDRLFFAFEPMLIPAIHVAQGEDVVLETHDCFEGQIQTPFDLIDKLDWNHVNPATGPVYIEGTKPGDILRVDLLEVKIGQQSSMVTIPGEGVLVQNQETF
jgi:amidase